MHPSLEFLSWMPDKEGGRHVALFEEKLLLGAEMIRTYEQPQEPLVIEETPQYIEESEESEEIEEPVEPVLEEPAPEVPAPEEPAPEELVPEVPAPEEPEVTDAGAPEKPEEPQPSLDEDFY